MTKSKHIPILDHLRGLAILAVCGFHFAIGNDNFLPSGDPVKAWGAFGWLGVEIFFVISGFVIPYSLYLRAYRIRDCTSFLARRLKRLEPPYLVCIVLVIVLHQLSALVPGLYEGTLDLTWQRLLAHFGYLNAIFDYGWLNPVFWTLAIEFQYYLFMAVAFPLLVHSNLMLRNLATLGIALLGLNKFSGSALLPFWLPLFALGIVTFQFYTNQLSRIWYSVILVIVFLISYNIVGAPQSIVGICTALTILVASERELPRIFAPLAFCGTISYSLYLLHTPIGGRIVDLATYLPNSVVYRYSALVVAFAVSVLSAYVFWGIVERPSQQWSKQQWSKSVPVSQNPEGCK